MSETNTQKPSTFLNRLFANPIVGIAGSIASIVGLVLAIYFYINSNYHRDFAYIVHPAKAIVVQAGQLSRLSVTLDGKKLSTDVTAAQIAFWNEGNAAIRSEHILQPFTLVTSPQTRIIEATVRKKSREPVLIDLDTNRMDKGELGVSWNILERGDGAILQIIFTGPPSTPISINGVIEGQRHLRKVEYGLSGSYAEWLGVKNIRARNVTIRNVIIINALLAAIVIGVGAFTWVRNRRRGIKLRMSLTPEAITVLSVVIIIATMIPLILLFQPEPPFGF